MLKKLFTSNTRIKLLTIFLMNSGEEFFIRELTRKLNEQINSVRRELDNLKKMGLLKAKTKNRKKYYHVNTDFIFFEELKSIIFKAVSTTNELAQDISKMGEVKLLILSGQFLDEETKTVDMLIVGDVDKEKLGHYLNNELKTKRPVKFAALTEADYKYRLTCKDKFITEIISDPENEVPIKKL